MSDWVVVIWVTLTWAAAAIAVVRWVAQAKR